MSMHVTRTYSTCEAVFRVNAAGKVVAVYLQDFSAGAKPLESDVAKVLGANYRRFATVMEASEWLAKAGALMAKVTIISEPQVFQVQLDPEKLAEFCGSFKAANRLAPGITVLEDAGGIHADQPIDSIAASSNNVGDG